MLKSLAIALYLAATGCTCEVGLESPVRSADRAPTRNAPAVEGFATTTHANRAQALDDALGAAIKDARERCRQQLCGLRMCRDVALGHYDGFCTPQGATATCTMKIAGTCHVEWPR